MKKRKNSFLKEFTEIEKKIKSVMKKVKYCSKKDLEKITTQKITNNYLTISNFISNFSKIREKRLQEFTEKSIEINL